VTRYISPDLDPDLRPVETYRYLRLITPLPAIWLLLAIATVAVVRHQFLDSISDYYGGPLRDVFVGTLMASAVGMIAYKGRSKLEDYALNFAGVNAFIVALVSNSFQGLLDAARATEGAPRPWPTVRSSRAAPSSCRTCGSAWRPSSCCSPCS